MTIVVMAAPAGWAGVNHTTLRPVRAHTGRPILRRAVVFLGIRSPTSPPDSPSPGQSVHALQVGVAGLEGDRHRR